MWLAKRYYCEYAYSHNKFSSWFFNLKRMHWCCSERGLKYIAIIDHFYNDGTELNRKNEVNRIAYSETRAGSTKTNVKVIVGGEFNIEQDITNWEKLRKLRWKLIGVHGWFLDREMTTLDELYSFFEDAAGKFITFVHIERELRKIDYCKHGDCLAN